jgi:hypothetical protein
VRVDGEREVRGIGAHLDRVGDLGDGLPGVRPDDAAPDDASSGLVEQQLGHALVAAQRQRAAAGGPGEDSLAVVDARSCGLGLGDAGPGDLRIGVGDRGNDRGVEVAWLTGGYLGGDPALVGRLVGQHRLAGDVPDRQDVRHVGALLLVDRDVAALVDQDAGVLRADRPAVGGAADGHQDTIEDVAVRGCWPLEACPQPGLARLDGGDLGVEVDVLVPAVDALGERADDVGVRARDDLVHQFDHGDPRAELVVDGGHLQADDPAADHQQAAGHRRHLERAGGVNDPGVIVRDERQADRLGADGDDRLVEADCRRAAVRADLNLAGGDEPAGALDGADLALAREARQAAGEPADDAVLPAAQDVQVDPRVAEADTAGAHLPGFGDHLGGVQQRLGRDAAHVQADPAEDGLPVDQGHLLAEVGGAEGGRVAARSGAEHQDFGVHVSHVFPTR